jgi:hypothetical protein
VFVLKLEPGGAAPVYSTFVSGAAADSASAIEIDTAGNAYVAGTTRSSDWPVTGNAFRPNWCGGSAPDGFVMKLNPTATMLAYSTYLCGAGADEPRAVTVDVSGNAYVGGRTRSIDFPTTAGAYQRAGDGAVGDGFVSKFGAAGGLAWSTYLGGSRDDTVESVQVDTAGRVYVAGTTASVDLPVSQGVIQPQHADGGQFADGFVAAFESAGDRLRFLSYFGGDGEDSISALALDGSGGLHVAGSAGERLGLSARLPG